MACIFRRLNLKLYASAANRSIPCDLLWVGLEHFWRIGRTSQLFTPFGGVSTRPVARYLIQRVIDTLWNILVKLVSCHHSFTVSFRRTLSHNSHELNQAGLQYWRGWLHGRVCLTGHSRRPLLFGWIWTELNGLSCSVAQCSLVIVVEAFLVFSHSKYAETLSPILSRLLDQHLPWQFHYSLPRRATSAPES